MALRISDREGSNPPNNSTTISISGSLTIDSKSVVKTPADNSGDRGLSSDRTPTLVISISFNRLFLPDGLRIISAVPVPTVPYPNKPILKVTTFVLTAIPYLDYQLLVASSCMIFKSRQVRIQMRIIPICIRTCSYFDSMFKIKLATIYVGTI